MGGDRDGNPNVNHKITKEVILLSRWEAANLYEKEITKIIQDLSMHECSNEIKKKQAKVLNLIGFILRPLRDKLQKTQKEIELYLAQKKKPLDDKLIVIFYK